MVLARFEVRRVAIHRVAVRERATFQIHRQGVDGNAGTDRLRRVVAAGFRRTGVAVRQVVPAGEDARPDLWAEARRERKRLLAVVRGLDARGDEPVDGGQLAGQ